METNIALMESTDKHAVVPLTYKGAIPASNLFLIDQRYAKRDSDIIVGEGYLKIKSILFGTTEWESLEAKPMDEEDFEEEPCRGDSDDDGTTPLKATMEDLRLEYEKAQQLIEELVKSCYWVDEFIQDPESKDGGFWTCRKPRIGDIVSLPRDLRVGLESQEPTEGRPDGERMNLDAHRQLGWDEEDLSIRVTLADILEHYAHELSMAEGPTTLNAIKKLGEWGQVCFTNAFKNYALDRIYSLRDWARQHPTAPEEWVSRQMGALSKLPVPDSYGRMDTDSCLKLLYALAQDRNRGAKVTFTRAAPHRTMFGSLVVDSVATHKLVKSGTFSRPWDFKWATEQVFVTIDTQWSKVIGDESLLWIQSVNNLYNTIQ